MFLIFPEKGSIFYGYTSLPSAFASVAQCKCNVFAQTSLSDIHARLSKDKVELSGRQIASLLLLGGHIPLIFNADLQTTK